MSEFSFAIDGLDKLAERLNGAMGRARKAATAELYAFGEEVMAASKEVVPVDTGTLMSTGHVEPPVEEGEQATVTLGYGGPAAPYALAVHENLDPDVHWHRPGSGPKYLENPLKERQDQLPGRVLDAFKSAV